MDKLKNNFRKDKYNGVRKSKKVCFFKPRSKEKNIRVPTKRKFLPDNKSPSESQLTKMFKISRYTSESNEDDEVEK